MNKRTTLANTRAQGLVCLVLLTLLGFSLGVSEFSVIGIESELARDFDVSLSQVGQLISLFALPYAVMTPVLTLATGRFRRYTLLVAYAIVFCAANLAAALAGNFYVLLAARMLLGSVSGTLLAVGITYIPELVSPKKISIAISVVYAAFSMAMVVATSAGKILADTIGWHYMMYSALTLAIVVCMALVLLMPRSGSTDEPATVKEQAALLAEPSIITGILIFVFGVGSVYVFYGYITPYLQQVLGMDTIGASTTLMVFGAICLVSNLLGGVVDSKFGMKALLLIFPLIALGLAGLMVAGSSVPGALGFIAVIALLMYTFSVSCISLFMKMANKFHPKALTMASSLEPLAFNIGISFGTAVGGLVVAGPGIEFVGGVGSIFAIVAALMTALTMLLGRKKIEGK